MQAPGQDALDQFFSMLKTQLRSEANISPKFSAGSGHPRMPASAQPHFQAHGCAVGLPQIAGSQAICELARSSLDSTPHAPSLRKNAPACTDIITNKNMKPHVTWCGRLHPTSFSNDSHRSLVRPKGMNSRGSSK